MLDRTKLLLGARYDRATLKNVFNGVSDTGDDTMDKKGPTVRVGLVQDLTADLTRLRRLCAVLQSGAGSLPQRHPRPGDRRGFRTGAEGRVVRRTARCDGRRLPAGTRQSADPRSRQWAERQLLRLRWSGTDRRHRTGDRRDAAARLDGGRGFGLAGSEYIDRQDPNFGKTPGGTVKRQSILYTSYELQQGRLKGLGFGVTLLSVGDRIVLTDENLCVAGYERVDLHGSYKGFPGWDLSLVVRNVTDEKYIERPNSAFLYGHFYGAPRSVLLRADYSFDL